MKRDLIKLHKQILDQKLTPTDKLELLADLSALYRLLEGRHDRN